MEKFKKLLEKKKQEGHAELSPIHAAAKSSVIGHLIHDMNGMGADKVKGLKKVTVASNSQPGLEHGLDTAKNLLQDHESDMADDSQEDEYDDQDKEGPNHIPTQPEFDKSNHSGNDLPDEEDEPEHEDAESPEEYNSEHGAEDGEPEHGSPEHVAKLMKDNEDMKAHIAHLTKPKSFY